MAAKMFGHFDKGNERIKVEFLGRSARVVASRMELRVNKRGQEGPVGERCWSLGTRWWGCRSGVTELRSATCFCPARELRNYAVTCGHCMRCKCQCPWIRFCWNTATLTHLHIICGSSHTVLSALRNCSRDRAACKGESVYYPALYRVRLLTPVWTKQGEWECEWGGRHRQGPGTV